MKTQCPHCKVKFNTGEKNAGKQAKCPKCAKPFTIEPFVEAAPAVESSVTSPKAVEEPVQKAEPQQVEPSAKAVEPKQPPVKSAKPIEPPPPAAPPAQSPEPEAPPTMGAGPEPVEAGERIVKPEPVSAPVKSAAPEMPPAKSEEPVKEEKSKSKALSKLLFVYLWAVVRIVTAVLAALGLMLALRKEPQSTLITTFAAADVFLAASVLIELMLFYKMWAAIQNGKVTASPAKAVWFLFIPVFNLYWALNMVIGFAEDYNVFIRRHSIKTKELPMMLFMVYAFALMLTMLFVTAPMLCVYAFVRHINRAFISYSEVTWLLLCFAVAAGLVHFITYILVSVKTCNAINALSQRRGG